MPMLSTTGILSVLGFPSTFVDDCCCGRICGLLVPGTQVPDALKKNEGALSYRYCATYGNLYVYSLVALRLLNH